MALGVGVPQAAPRVGSDRLWEREVADIGNAERLDTCKGCLHVPLVDLVLHGIQDAVALQRVGRGWLVG